MWRRRPNRVLRFSARGRQRVMRARAKVVALERALLPSNQPICVFCARPRAIRQQASGARARARATTKFDLTVARLRSLLFERRLFRLLATRRA